MYLSFFAAPPPVWKPLMLLNFVSSKGKSLKRLYIRYLTWTKHILHLYLFVLYVIYILHLFFWQKRLEEKEEKIAPDTLLGTTHTYVVPSGAQDKTGAKRVRIFSESNVIVVKLDSSELCFLMMRWVDSLVGCYMCVKMILIHVQSELEILVNAVIDVGLIAGWYTTSSKDW